MRGSGLPQPSSPEIVTRSNTSPSPLASSFVRCTSGMPLVTSPSRNRVPSSRSASSAPGMSGFVVARSRSKRASSSRARASSSTPQAAAEALPANLMAAAAPADAKDVAQVRKAAADGDEVVVRGRIAGSKQPFTEGRAQFQLVDVAVKSCDQVPGDSCPTPWDMCCEDKKDVAANSVTVATTAIRAIDHTVPLPRSLPSPPRGERRPGGVRSCCRGPTSGRGSWTRACTVPTTSRAIASPPVDSVQRRRLPRNR